MARQPVPVCLMNVMANKWVSVLAQVYCVWAHNGSLLWVFLCPSV